jgi:hypothetical protein
MGKVFPEYAVMQAEVQKTAHATAPNDVWSDKLLLRMTREKQDKPRPHPTSILLLRNGQRVKMELKTPEEWEYYKIRD